MALPMGLVPYDLFQASRTDARLVPLFWVQCGSIVCGVAVGLWVVVAFFRGIVRRCNDGDPGSTRRKALLQWMQASTGPLRAIKVLSVFKPSVLCLIRCRLGGLVVLSGPVSPYYVGWRWMWIGDGVESVVMDCTQLVVLVLRHQWSHPHQLSTVAIVSAAVNLLSMVQSVGQVVSAQLCEPYGTHFESTSHPVSPNGGGAWAPAAAAHQYTQLPSSHQIPLYIYIDTRMGVPACQRIFCL
jgi:hypothetical protein